MIGAILLMLLTRPIDTTPYTPMPIARIEQKAKFDKVKKTKNNWKK